MPAHQTGQRTGTSAIATASFGFGAARPFIIVRRFGSGVRSALRYMESQDQLAMSRAMGEGSFKTGLPHPMAMPGLARR